MTPAELSVHSFVSYPAEGRQFAAEFLPLLQRLPLAVCPSFLQQIQGLNTMFPAEHDLLRRQCEFLQQLPAAHLASLTAPLAALSLPATLRDMDWIQQPSRFVSELTAHLWSSSQINTFRDATNALFAAVPPHEDTSARVVVVILGQGATVEPSKVLRKLRAYGITLTGVQHQTAFADITQLLAQRRPSEAPAYSSWYIDGNTSHAALASSVGTAGVAVSYTDLAPVRERVLQRMQANLAGGNTGAEQMRTHMLETTARDADSEKVTTDPVLQRFYTELFTASSGPQIFSTSFVQWAGRELARRARPQQMVLRYAPRQRHRSLNDMFAQQDTSSFDPQGSLLDAEMGAYYAWLEMKRISAPGKLTFLAWIENQPIAVLLSPNAPQGVVSGTPMTLAHAISSFA